MEVQISAAEDVREASSGAPVREQTGEVIGWVTVPRQEGFLEFYAAWLYRCECG